jgi:hypothetical protein
MIEEGNIEEVAVIMYKYLLIRIILEILYCLNK